LASHRTQNIRYQFRTRIFATGVVNHLAQGLAPPANVEACFVATFASCWYDAAPDVPATV
jgi:hypothetical protein